jgi:hypothetical protein
MASTPNLLHAAQYRFQNTCTTPVDMSAECGWGHARHNETDRATLPPPAQVQEGVSHVFSMH